MKPPTQAPGGATPRRPAVRVQYRQDSSARTTRWTFTRVERWAVPPAIGLVVFLMGLPEDLGATEAYLLPAAMGLGVALFYLLARRLDLVAAAALAIPYVAAFALGAGDASLRGVAALDVYARPGSVYTALLMVMIFLGILVLGSAGVERLLRRFWPPRPDSHVPDPMRSVFSVGLAILLIFSLFVAIAVGGFTIYGGAPTDVVDRTGGFRWEFFYEPALVSAFGLTIDQLVRLAEGRESWKRFPLLASLLAALTVLLFIRQVRRVMIFALLTGFLQVAWNPTASLRWLGSLWRALLVGVLLVGLAIGLNYASIAWRISSAQFATNDLSKRLEDTVSRVDEASEFAAGNAKARLNYLWLDAASVEYQPILERNFSLPEAFIRSLYSVLPGAIVPIKYQYGPMTCETAFANLHLDNDLACTPTAEGYIGGGLLGVVVVALSWVPVVGLACFLLRRRTALGIIMAMHLLDPLCVIEASAFPQLVSIRAAACGLFALMVASALGVLFFGWGVLSPAKGRPRAV